MVKQSNLESQQQLLKPKTTLGGSSSSDGSVSSKESERDLSVSGEEMIGQEDSGLMKKCHNWSASRKQNFFVGVLFRANEAVSSFQKQQFHCQHRLHQECFRICILLLISLAP